MLTYLLQELVSVAVQNVQDMETIVKEPKKNGIINSSHSNGNDPYKHFVSKEQENPFRNILKYN